MCVTSFGKSPAGVINRAALACHAVCDAIDLIPRALHNRARDATARNATSSRSHAVVKLRLERAPAGHEGQWLVSTMFLVDLAGRQPRRVQHNMEGLFRALAGHGLRQGQGGYTLVLVCRQPSTGTASDYSGTTQMQAPRHKCITALRGDSRNGFKLSIMLTRVMVSLCHAATHGVTGSQSCCIRAV